MKKKILFILVILMFASSLSAARVRGTKNHPIRVSALEQFLDGPYPGPPPNVSGCSQKTVPAKTKAYAYSARKGWGYGPLKYDQPAWVASNGEIKKWEQCGNPAAGCIPCKKPPCIKTPPCEKAPEETKVVCNRTEYGAAEGSPTIRMNVNSQYSPTVPRESVDNGGWSIPFGVFGVPQTETVINGQPCPEKPECAPIDTPTGQPIPPTQSQVW